MMKDMWFLYGLCHVEKKFVKVLVMSDFCVCFYHDLIIVSAVMVMFAVDECYYNELAEMNRACYRVV